MDPPKGSIIYTIGIFDYRTGGSINSRAQNIVPVSNPMSILDMALLSMILTVAHIHIDIWFGTYNLGQLPYGCFYRLGLL